MLTYIPTLALYLSFQILDLINLFIIFDKFYEMERKRIEKKAVLIIAIYLIAWPILILWSMLSGNSYLADLIVVFSSMLQVPILIYFFKNKGFVTIQVFFYRCILELLSFNIFYYVSNDEQRLTSAIYMQTHLIALYEFLATLTLFIVLLTLYVLRKKEILKVYFLQLKKRTLFLYAIVFFIMAQLQSDFYALLLHNHIVYKAGHVLLLSLYGLIIVMMFDSIITNQRRTVATEGLEQSEKQVEHLHEYYKELSAKNLELRRFRHDVNNFMIALHGLIENKEYEDALVYLEHIDGIQKSTVNQYNSGNIVADSLLEAKQGRAKEHQIDVEFSGVIPSSGIRELDISIILSNLLDNAIEACEKMDGKKKIEVKSMFKHQIWTLKVSNPVQEKVKIRGNQIATNKKNQNRHGFGLLNVERSVKKYDGQFNLACTSHQFDAQVVMSLKK